MESDRATASDEQRATEVPQRMRRCFMTGKQCIFRPQATGAATGEPQYGVFVVMPFRPNLDTFFEWSLRPFLGRLSRYAGEPIRRADQISKIGYVMCENICRRIQNAKLVVIDLSVTNANVFYELGLAVGLGKRLLILCDGGVEHSTDYWDAIGIPEEKVLEYPSIGHLTSGGKSIEDYEWVVPLPPRDPEMVILPLLVPGPDEEEEETGGGAQPKDISVTFEDAIKAAVGVAIAQIDARASRDGEGEAELTTAVRSLGDKSIESLGKCTPQYLVNAGDGKMESTAAYKEMAAAVESAFACIVDLFGEHPLSYFWLGYCHARGVNVIPVSRSPNGQGPKQPLAFDIRSLWCVEYHEARPKELASTLQDIFEELIVKDIPTQQRQTFWERLTRRGIVHIYTGAVHHDGLSREVVGDWDLRTVSELVRYLSSTQESVVPKFANPVYAPETIMDKLKRDLAGEDAEPGEPVQDDGALGHEEVRKYYLTLAAEELRNKSCLIVASADVNPFTELVLARAYQARFGPSWKKRCFPEANDQRGPDVVNTVVALKGTHNPAEKAIRQFSRQDHPALKEEVDPMLGKAVKSRGFLADGRQVIQAAYRSQDVLGKPFDVLAHLMIVRNQFSENLDDVIVVLDGVSGPGTFGLAEVLTGGDRPEKAANSEGILKCLNAFWDEHAEDANFGGIEAFISVRIDPQGLAVRHDDIRRLSLAGRKEFDRVAGKFYDNRLVADWQLCAEDIHQIDNPRVVSTFPETRDDVEGAAEPGDRDQTEQPQEGSPVPS